MTTSAPVRPNTAQWPVYERSIMTGVLGLPGYAAIGIALGFTALGVFIDLTRISGLGSIFKGCYFAGCVLSVCWVKRRALFGPVVQPPLLLALTVPVVVLASGGGGGGPSGLTDHLLSIGTPLLNGFPTMAVTTAFAVAIGIVRYMLQRPENDPNPPRVFGRTASDRSAAAPSGSRRSVPDPRPASGRDPRRAAAPPGSRGERRTPRDRNPRERATPERASDRAASDRLPPGRRPPPGGDRRPPADWPRERRVPPEPGERRPPPDLGARPPGDRRGNPGRSGTRDPRR